MCTVASPGDGEACVGVCRLLYLVVTIFSGFLHLESRLLLAHTLEKLGQKYIMLV